MARRATPRVATARVVDGKVVTRAKFPEGTRLVLQVSGDAVEPEPDDEVAIGKALASIRAGKGISSFVVRAILRRS